MNTKEILQADLLDILFEHRNRAYGAYALRRHYNKRMFTALGIALSAVVVLYLVSLLKQNTGKESILSGSEKTVVTVCPLINIKPLAAEKITQRIKKTPPITTRDFRTFRIVKDKNFIRPLVKQADLVGPQISDQDKEGKIAAEPARLATGSRVSMGSGNGSEDKGQAFEPKEFPPSFPGGASALVLFFSRTLNSPTDLAEGEKKEVLVRFIVDMDGSVSKAEIIQSAGSVYDREVLRAFKKMPHWIPGRQNGIKVAVSFTQPVTFCGIEQ